jgi:hypothetical protein
MSFKISFRNEDNTFTLIDSKTKEISIVESVSYKIYKHRFTLSKRYPETEEGIRQYLADFTVWCKEMRARKMFHIDYKGFSCDNTAVLLTFMNNCNKNILNMFDDIDLKEMMWINACHNGGLTFVENGTYDCYGYDFKMFYPTILGSREHNMTFKYPTKKGKQYKVKKLNFNKPLRFGYYKVMITSDHPDRLKLFAFSSKNIYTNYAIEFAYNHLADYNFKIELIVDDTFNAYLYDDDCIIESHKVFNEWFYKLKCMRADLPKNPLVKYLLSSLSGQLTSYNIELIKINELPDEVDERLCSFCDNMDIKKYDKAIYDVFYDDNNPDNNTYKIIDLHKPMKYGVGRFKAFLMAFARNLTASIAMTDLQNVVRIHTDGIVFKKEQDFSKSDVGFKLNGFLIPEEKTTGNIHFETINKYYKI